MAKGGFPGMGGGNMGNMMKQMQKMQKQMEEAQKEAEAKEISITSGGGAVNITVNGKKEIVKLELSKEIVDPDDIEMLQDLIIAAVNEGIREAGKSVENAMEKITGNIKIPGMF